MKVAILGDYPIDPKIIFGGVEAVTCNLVEGLQKFDDLEIHVVTCRREIKKPYTIFNKSFFVHYLLGQKSLNHITMNVFDVIRLRKKIKEIMPDIIHSHNQDRYTQAALKMAYPIVTTISSISYEDFRSEKSLVDRILRKRSESYIENIFLKKAKYIIAISPYVKSIFSRRTNAIFFDIPNPVKDGFYNINNNEEKNRILFAGRVVPLKGIHVLLKALVIVRKAIPSIILHIAGPILKKDYYNSLMDYINKNNLINNVKFMGLLDESQLMKEYAKCAIFVLPSLSETFSLVVAQALASAKPVIATHVGGLPSIINDGVTGFLLKPNDVYTFAERIIKLLLDDALRSKMGLEGKNVASKRFRTDIIAGKTRQVYELVYDKNLIE